MTNRPTSELELSPHVIKHWEDQGYCVHGEVAVYGKSIFVDHVAHTGPCGDPDHVVGLEMKKGSNSSLRRQMFKLDIYHLCHEMWGVVIATPQARTVGKWDDAYKGGRWLSPGLMSWSSDGFEVHSEAVVVNDKHLGRYTNKLLLVDENRKTLAGYTSGGDHDYCTHYKMLCSWVADWSSRCDSFLLEDLKAAAPSYVDLYSDKSQALGRVLRDLAEDGIVEKKGKNGRRNVWGRSSMMA